MQLLDQQMSTKKKMTEETEEKKTTNEGQNEVEAAQKTAESIWLHR